MLGLFCLYKVSFDTSARLQQQSEALQSQLKQFNAENKQRATATAANSEKSSLSCLEEVLNEFLKVFSIQKTNINNFVIL